MKALATVALLGLLACGRNAVRLETQTFELRYLQAERAASIIDPYVYHDRPGAQGRISVTGNVLTIRETHDNLERIARVLAQYDRPQPTVQLTFRLIQADGVASVDPAIADLEATLRKLFRFRGYRLVGEGVVSGVEGSEVSQMLGGGGSTYELAAEIQRLSTGTGDSASVLLQVHLNLFPGSFQTRVGVPLGKTAVLGNVQGGPSKMALILTVRPELVAN